MNLGLLFTIIFNFFNVLAWPSFTLAYPLYASIKAIESNTYSKYQACLTYWVLFSVATVVESMLSKLISLLPFWPYAKGIAILLLVVPYFHGASFVYSLLIKPYTPMISSRSDIMDMPTRDVYMVNEQKDILDSAESCTREKREDESEKVVIYEVEGKKHNGKEDEHGRNKVVANEAVGSSLVMNTEERVPSFGNLNHIKWVNLKRLSYLLGPVARSIGWYTWEKPELGWTKLNSDGSVDRDGARLGGLLRDYKGDPICAYVSKASGDDIFLVELWAIWRGLVLAMRLGIKTIWAESDSMSVVKTINREQPYGSRASRCLKDIWKLLKKFKQYKVTHSCRETNRAADHLAKMDVEESDLVLWPADFPVRLCNIIRDDAQGRWYCRA